MATITSNPFVKVFPINKSYEPFLQRLTGGGVTSIGETVYAMNSLEPHIYVYNVNTLEQSTLRPYEWEEFDANVDRSRVEQLSLGNWDKESADFAYFMDIDKLIVGRSGALVIFLRYRGKLLLHIIDLDEEVLYASELEGLWFVGSQGDLLFFLSTKEYSDLSILLIYRYERCSCPVNLISRVCEAVLEIVRGNIWPLG